MMREEGKKWDSRVHNWVSLGNKGRRGRPTQRWRDEFVKEKGSLWQRAKWRDSVEDYAQKWAFAGWFFPSSHQQRLFSRFPQLLISTRHRHNTPAPLCNVTQCFNCDKGAAVRWTLSFLYLKVVERRRGEGTGICKHSNS